MKKGIHCRALPGSLDIAGQLQFAKAAGFAGVELALTLKGELSFESTPDQIAAIKTAADRIGIKILSITCGLNWLYSLTSNSEPARQQGKNNLLKQIEVASILDAGAILALPGLVGVDLEPRALFPDLDPAETLSAWEVVDYDAAWRRAVAAFKEVAPVAEENHIYVCVENVWSKFLLSPLEMRNFIDEIGSPYVQSYLDVGNMMLYGYPEQWIKILGQRIKRVHFKDFRRGSATLDGFVDLLAGDVDFIRVMAALQAIGYDGWVTGEITPYKQHPEQAAFNCSAAMDKILGFSIPASK
jgi:L-ribulose-5-phosphate 3-epimerase